MALGLPDATPHALRHGGASLDALMGVELDVIQERGRWNGPRAVLRYKRTGRYLRQLALLSDQQKSEAVIAERFLQSHLPVQIRKVLRRYS